jgi:hypothetical protein
MRRTQLTSWAGLAAAATLASPGPLAAQFSEPPEPAAYALQGVTVVRPDGTRQAGVNLVIRGGKIEAIGAALAIPADAKLLEGDSLYVYPGIIDAQGEADYEFPEQEIDRSEVASWNPPRHVQGFMPHRRVVDYLEATGGDLADQRKEGVVAAAVHPSGRMMPGRGVLLVFRTDAETPEALVVQSTLGPLMTFQGAGGVYPSSLFAVIAFYRQMFLDAAHHAAQQQAFDRNPGTLERPAWDPDMEVVREVMAARAPVFFAADLARDIQRVLKLAREHGFRPIIVGGQEAWKVADELSAQNVPVLASLDFPKPKRWKPEKKKEEKEAEPEPEPGSNGAESQDEEAEGKELDAGALREKQELEDKYANAGRLAAAGVRFALTSGGGKAEIREGTRKAIEYGLKEDDALRAVSTTPATLLGLEPLVRLQAGSSATLLVTDGPLFDEDTKIRYTFVAGGLEEGKKESAGSGEEPSVDMTGSWEVTVDTGDETITAVMKVTQEGAKFAGTMETPFGEGKVEDGTVSGNAIEFAIVIGAGEESMRVEVRGTVEGENASGDGDSPDGSFTWTARRTSGPGGGIDR